MKRTQTQKNNILRSINRRMGEGVGFTKACAEQNISTYMYRTWVNTSSVADKAPNAKSVNRGPNAKSVDRARAALRVQNIPVTEENILTYWRKYMKGKSCKVADLGLSRKDRNTLVRLFEKYGYDLMEELDIIEQQSD